MIRGYKFRCYPTNQQKKLFDQAFKDTNIIYNQLLTCYNKFIYDIRNVSYVEQYTDVIEYYKLGYLENILKTYVWNIYKVVLTNCTESGNYINFISTKEGTTCDVLVGNKVVLSYKKQSWIKKSICLESILSKLKVLNKNEYTKFKSEFYYDDFQGKGVSTNAKGKPSKYLKVHDLKKDSIFYNVLSTNQNCHNVLNGAYKTDSRFNLSSTTIEYVAKTLEESFERMYKKSAKKPRKKDLDSNKSFTIRYTNMVEFSVVGDVGKKAIVNIPAKTLYGNITIKYHRKFPDNCSAKYVTISKDKDKYFASFSIEYNQEPFEIKSKPLKNIGVDRNVKHNVIQTSDLQFNEENKSLFDKDFKLLEYRNLIISKQRKLSNAINNKLELIYGKGNTHNKQLKTEEKTQKIYFLEKELSNLHTKVKNYRSNKNWMIANKLSDISENIVFEDLNIKNMTKKAKQKKVKQKSGLNREILNAAWYDIELKTKIKAEEKGGRTTKVSAKNTSIRCNSCGHISKENRKTQKVFCCVKCNHTNNADLNASNNILDKHLEKW